MKYEYRSIGGLAPAAIAFVEGVPLVVGEISRGDAKKFYDCPEPPFVIHHYQSERWKRADLTVIPPKLTEMNLALFSNPAMESAKAGKLATAEQISEWNKTLGRRGVGKYSETSADSIPKPASGKIEYQCNVEGKLAAIDIIEFKAEMRRRLPSNVE
jgi:hypothetical protein